MKIKTAEASKLQLDWGLAQIEAKKMTTEKSSSAPAIDDDKVYVRSCLKWTLIDHTDPAVCMGLIKEHKITLAYWNIAPVWSATPDDRGWDEHGDTPEQAVARCVIAMRLGDEFECPSELGVVG